MALGLRIGDALSNLILSQMLRAQECEDEEDVRRSKKQLRNFNHKNVRSISKLTTNGGDITAVLLGVMLVAGVATIASYQAIHMNDYSSTLSKKQIQMDPEVAMDEKAFPYDGPRLPRMFIPEAYLLFVSANMTNSVGFIGLVKINVTCVQNTSVLLLHSAQHTILRVVLKTGDNRQTLNVTRVQRFDKVQRLLVETEQEMLNGSSYNLFISFRYSLTGNENTGIFLTDYFLASGQKRRMMSTMFHPTYARKAFPCFDEPEYKATFDLILMHNSSYKAISNMLPYRNIYLSNWKQETHFKQTPLMSSHLLSFFLTEYAFKEVISVNGIPVRVFAPEDRMDEANLALKFVPLFVDFYSYKFGVMFPLPKLDLVPVANLVDPADEAWGTISFREEVILLPADRTKDLKNLYNTLSITGHKITHQWFGDLVTLKWWNDLWLKESFAIYLASVALDYYLPSWNMDSFFYVTYCTRSLLRDSFVSSQPVASREIRNMESSDLISNYASINYDKGACVLDMLRSFMGSSNFFLGISEFLHRYAYQHAASDDFFAVLGHKAGQDTISFVHNWLYKPGYPVVYAVIKHGNLSLHQEQFTYAVPSLLPKSPTSTVWQIHVVVQANGIGNFNVFMTNKTAERSIPANMVTWFKCNWGATGFYRVNYDQENWLLLKEQLLANHKVIPSVDRANLIEDAMHLARGNQLDLDLALGLTKYLKDDHSYAPWAVALNHLNYMKMIFDDNVLKDCFKKYMLRQLTPLLQYISKEIYLTHDEKLLKPLLYGIASVSDSEVYVLELRNLFLKWMFEDGATHLPGDMLSEILCTGARYGGEDEFNFLLVMLKRSRSYADRSTIIAALACTQATDRLKRLLDLAGDSTVVRQAERIHLYARTCLNPLGRELTWSLVQQQWETLSSTFEGAHDELRHLLESCLALEHTAGKLNEAVKFFNFATMDEATQVASEVLVETIKRNIDFVNRHDVAARSWFKAEEPTCLT